MESLDSGHVVTVLAAGAAVYDYVTVGSSAAVAVEQSLAHLALQHILHLHRVSTETHEC